MITLVKHEWHSVDSQFALELTEELLKAIYPEMTKKEIKQLYKDISVGNYDVETVIEDAFDSDVELEWERQYDDWYTDRNGGYDVSYELGDDSSWHSTPAAPEATHKCTKCRWTGQNYDPLTQHLREDNTLINDYWNSEEESHHTKEVCPMCDSDLELTEEGIRKDKEMRELLAGLDD